MSDLSWFIPLATMRRNYKQIAFRVFPSVLSPSLSLSLSLALFVSFCFVALSPSPLFQFSLGKTSRRKVEFTWTISTVILHLQYQWIKSNAAPSTVFRNVQKYLSDFYIARDIIPSSVKRPSPLKMISVSSFITASIERRGSSF